MRRYLRSKVSCCTLTPVFWIFLLIASTPIASQDSYEKQIEQASTYLANGLYEKAITNLQQALHCKPNAVQAYCFDESFDQLHGRFMDTAAVMKCIDLVITIDTSIAHLAGALGVPVWVMLPYVADWRWMQHRSDSPWYPTMRIFKQPRLSDWDSLIQCMADEIKKIIEQRNHS